MRERTLLAIGERAAARVARGSPIEDALATQIDWDLTVAENAAALQPLVAGAGALDVVVDDRVARYFLVAAPEGTASLAELRSVASVRLAELFGIDAQTFDIAADWRASGSFLCCAIARSTRQAVEAAASLARVSLASFGPLFVRVINSEAAARRHSGWVVVRANGWVTAGHLEQGSVRLIRSGALDALRPLEPWLAQLALTCGQAIATPLALDADQPHKLAAGWSPMQRDRRDVDLLASIDAAMESA